MSTILIVDDEKSVLAFLQVLLKKRGYKVLTAGNAAEALRYCRDYPEEIQVMITDLSMPEVDGLQLARQAVPIRPDMRVVFASALLHQVLIQHGVLPPDAPFLQKPFVLSVVQETLSALLDRG